MAPMRNMLEITTSRCNELDLVAVGAKVGFSESSVDGETEFVVGEIVGVAPFTSVAKVGFSESSVDGEMEIVVGEMVGVAPSTSLAEVGFSESSVDGLFEGAVVSQPPQNSARNAKEAQLGPAGTIAAKKTKSLQVKPSEADTVKSDFTGFVPSGQREHVGSAPGHSHHDAVWRARKQCSGSPPIEASRSKSRHVVFKYGMSFSRLYVWLPSGQIVQELPISGCNESHSSPWNP